MKLKDPPPPPPPSSLDSARSCVWLCRSLSPARPRSLLTSIVCWLSCPLLVLPVQAQGGHRHAHSGQRSEESGENRPVFFERTKVITRHRLAESAVSAGPSLTEAAGGVVSAQQLVEPLLTSVER